MTDASHPYLRLHCVDIFVCDQERSLRFYLDQLGFGLLALYTDGATESFNAAGEEFGEQGVLSALERHRDLPPAEMVQRILADVLHFGWQEQHDDITLIVAKCKGA